jgi:hypothetical protein
LSQGDAVQSSKPPDEQMTPEARRRAMFDPDKAKVFEADVFFFVLDGCVLDEGAWVQLVIAHSQKVFEHPKKLLV